MKRIVFLFCLLTAVLTGTAQEQACRVAGQRPADEWQSQPVPVYIVAGQSNADGRVPQSQLPEYIRKDGYRYCLWSYGSGDMLRASGRFVPYKPHVAKVMDEDCWGFDAIVYHLLDSALSRPYYVIKQTVGGTAIDTLCRRSTRGMFWCAAPDYLSRERSASRGGHSLLLALKEQIDECVDSTLSQLSEGYDIRALIWHQGESDQSQGGCYADNFREVVSALRHHLVEKTGEQRYARLPVICGTFSKNSRQGSAQVAEALRQLERTELNIHVVEASDLTLLRDRLHFDAQGAEELGRRVFRLLQTLPLCLGTAAD